MWTEPKIIATSFSLGKKTWDYALFKGSKIPILKYQINGWWVVIKECKILCVPMPTKENKENPLGKEQSLLLVSK
ncbi:hypothetical protein [Spiroplasma poulsonii]|uniref:hypothetical protein n=1 Tax=Spiroplasma poulsonii TaxID=2138 RepID=UPI001F4CC6B9|nr:hypothetical protein [Spiroplasma poulsonii]UNF61536.1 hypothetical protein MNU24_06370 [Spiroplasma poulsonii]